MEFRVCSGTAPPASANTRGSTLPICLLSASTIPQRRRRRINSINALEHQMSSHRPRIPRPIADSVLYKSAHTCCICRKKTVIIHHIDGNNENNTETNLVALCSNCHDEAHTTRKLTRSLDPNSLKSMKAKWESEVSALSLYRISSEHSDSLQIRTWNYFNPSLLLDLARIEQFDPLSLQSFRRAQACALIDDHGIPMSGSAASSPRTIFETHSLTDAYTLHRAFSDLTEWLIRCVPPTELSRMWSRPKLRNLAATNAIVFMNRGLYFSPSSKTESRDERIAHYARRSVRIQFQIDAWNVYGSSALTLHFTGHHRVASLLLLRSAEVNIINELSILLVNATPIALGTGFPAEDNYAPLIKDRGMFTNESDFPDTHDSDQLNGD